MEERRKPILGRVVPGVSPDVQRKLRRFYALVQFVSPWLAGRMALAMFLSPPRRKVEDSDVPVLAQAVRSQVRVAGDTYTLWRWGEGVPRVVLLHGWGSHAARFGDFVAPLRAAGFTVLGIDAPAHGDSPGRSSDLPRFRDSLAAVLHEHAPVHAVIGHSLGGGAMITLLAEGATHPPMKIVLFGVPSDMDYLLESFAMMLGFRAPALARLRASFAARFGREAREVSISALAPQVRCPALVIHDEDDTVAPIERGAALAAAIPGATFLRTHGLGHSNALRDPAIIARVVEFLCS